MNRLIHTVFGRVLELLFPDRCLGCGKKDELLCPACAFETKKQSRHKNSILFLDKLCYWGLYEDKILSSALRRFKYHGTYGLAQPFSEMLKEIITPCLPPSGAETLVIPIPAHLSRKNDRGYNQAELLAEKLAEKIQLPFNSEVLTKSRNTKSQTSLPSQDRIFNVKNSFIVTNPEIVKNKKIILVDDIVTTGATLSEAARVLKEAGAEEVIGLVVAK